MSRDESLEKKVYKLPGGEQFKSEVDRLSVAQLEARISSLQKQLEESEDHKENNEALKQLRGELNEMLGPYRDVKNAVKVKTKYILALLKEKGAL